LQQVDGQLGDAGRRLCALKFDGCMKRGERNGSEIVDMGLIEFFFRKPRESGTNVGLLNESRDGPSDDGSLGDIGTSRFDAFIGNGKQTRTYGRKCFGGSLWIKGFEVVRIGHAAM